jgi:hypothetical protein
VDDIPKISSLLCMIAINLNELALHARTGGTISLVATAQVVTFGNQRQLSCWLESRKVDEL